MMMSKKILDVKISTELGKLDKELEQAKNKAPVSDSSVLLRFLNESIAKKE